jgi:signal transduction histidine kinase
MPRVRPGVDSRFRFPGLHFPRVWRPDPHAPVSVAWSVLGFAASGLAAVALVSIGVIYFARATATDEAIRDSIRLTEVVSRGLIEPVLDDGILSGDPVALQRLDQVVRENVIGGSVVRVKLWTKDGRIVYSDEPRIVGQRYPISEDDLAAFETDEAEAEISDLSRPENLYERPFTKLLEVYFPVRTKGDTTLLFEAYLPYSSVSSNASVIWRHFMPAFVAGLVVLAVIQIPLAWSLAYRLRRRQNEREALLRRAAEASDRERSIIAGELHDGAVQDLIGQSFRILAAADRLTGIAPDETVRDLREASEQARSTVQELRSLLVELYPSRLSSEGLEPAFSDLAAPLSAKGVKVTISVNSPTRLPERIERLIFRSAREALRNVLLHAGASNVDITMECRPGVASLTISDDGRGFSAEDRERQRAAGHLGLDLVEGLVANADGTCRVLPREGGGTRFIVEVPVR